MNIWRFNSKITKGDFMVKIKDFTQEMKQFGKWEFLLATAVDILKDLKGFSGFISLGGLIPINHQFLT